MLTKVRVLEKVLESEGLHDVGELLLALQMREEDGSWTKSFHLGKKDCRVIPTIGERLLLVWILEGQT